MHQHNNPRLLARLQVLFHATCTSICRVRDTHHSQQMQGAQTERHAILRRHSTLALILYFHITAQGAGKVSLFHVLLHDDDNVDARLAAPAWPRPRGPMVLVHWRMMRWCQTMVDR